MKYRIDTKVSTKADPISISLDLADKDWYKRTFDSLVEKYDDIGVDVKDAIKPILNACIEGGNCSGNVAIEPNGINIGYRVTQLLSEEAWDNLSKAIGAAPAPTQELSDLMLRPRNYQLVQPKELTVTITAVPGAGKTTVAAILAKLLKSAGIVVEVRSDDMGKMHREMDVMTLVNQLKNTGSKVIINDTITKPLKSTGEVLTVPEMAAAVRGIELAEDFMVKISDTTIRSSRDCPPEVAAMINRLADMGLIVILMTGFNYMISSLGVAVVQYCRHNPLEEDLVVIDNQGDLTPEPLYSTARLAFYRIRDNKELNYVFNSYDSADEDDRLHVAELINIGVLTEENNQLRLTKLGEEVEKFMNDTSFDNWAEL